LCLWNHDFVPETKEKCHTPTSVPFRLPPFRLHPVRLITISPIHHFAYPHIAYLRFAYSHFAYPHLCGEWGIPSTIPENLFLDYPVLHLAWPIAPEWSTPVWICQIGPDSHSSGSRGYRSLSHSILLPYQCFFQDFKRAGISSGFLGKGEGAVLAKKGQFASYKEKLEKFTEFHYF
jgi:hypothetical protein